MWKMPVVSEVKIGDLYASKERSFFRNFGRVFTLK